MENAMCRACLQKSTDLVSKDEMKLVSEIFYELTRISLSGSIGLFTFCQNCKAKLFEFNTFKNQCVKNDSILTAVRNTKLKVESSLSQVQQQIQQTESPPSPHVFRFQCSKNECEKKFKNQTQLDRHLVRFHDSKKLQVCPICNLELKTNRNLKRHLELHSNERKYKCSYCPKFFKTNSQVEVHQRYIHEKKKAFICNQCGAIYYNPTGLSTHIYNKHNPERKFHCDICPKKFKSKLDLQDHQMRHVGERKFECTMESCGKKFITQKDLRKHTREKHSSSDNSIPCEICSMVLKDKKTLRHHMFTHTGHRPFVCSICEKGFTIKKALERHQTVHTGIRPFICSICSKTFAERFYMNRHIERNHGVNPAELSLNFEDKRYLCRQSISKEVQEALD